MKALVTAAFLGVLTACAAPHEPVDGAPPVRDIEGSCQAEPGQRFIGTRATAAVGSELLAATGATLLRWVPPRTAVTMDFNPNRLTVTYDDAMVITRVSCT